jgi:hypothetical protein
MGNIDNTNNNGNNNGFNMNMNIGMNSSNQNLNQFPANNFYNNPSQVQVPNMPNGNLNGLNNYQQNQKMGNIRKNKITVTNSVPDSAPSINPSDLGMDVNGINGLQNNYGYNTNNQNQFMGINNNTMMPQGGLNGIGGQLPQLPQLGLNQNNIQLGQNPQMLGGINFPMNTQVNNMIPNPQAQGRQNLKKSPPKISSQVL